LSDRHNHFQSSAVNCSSLQENRKGLTPIKHAQDRVVFT
jgi:hypothetical protein